MRRNERSGWRGIRSLACARCDFYVPKASNRAQLLEAKASLQRMALTIPLTDDERAAVDEGADAVQRLLARLEDTATPAGPTPRELQPPPGPLLSNIRGNSYRLKDKLKAGLVRPAEGVGNFQ